MAQDNAADRRQVRRAQKQSKVREQQDRGVVAGLMDTRQGRAWMLDHLEFCHIFASNFSGNPYNDALGEGQRTVGLRLLGQIMSACPDQYVTMMRERNERDTADANERSTATEQPGREDLGRDVAGSADTEYDLDGDEAE